jgi:DNA-binding SARP family transcriptional activator/FixJ family two-component response regulator
VETTTRSAGHILVIDDDPVTRETVAELLRAEHYSVACAANGWEAINHLRRSLLPHVILLDLMMPVMDGWEFRRQQLQDSALAAIPVIVLSSLVDISQDASAPGGISYLPKPVDFRRLITLVASNCPRLSSPGAAGEESDALDEGSAPCTPRNERHLADGPRAVRCRRSPVDTPWRIGLLGELRATRGGTAGEAGGPVITRFRTPKTGLLLAYLAYHCDRSHSRSALLDLLWPDCRPEAARCNLNVALSWLHRQLAAGGPAGGQPEDREVGPPDAPSMGGVIVANRDTVQLNPTAVSTDVAEFEAALETAARATGGTERAQWLIRALELYRGELLPGYFEDWVLEQRQWLAERYFQALRQLAAELEREGDFRSALQYARRAVCTEPAREEAHHDLIRLYARVF